MRTTFEVMQAVQDGTPATEEELRYALRNVECWFYLHMMDIARGGIENPVSEKTRRGLTRAWENWHSGNKVPLDVRLNGTSSEPGLTREERMKRGSERTADFAVKLADTLTAVRTSPPEVT